MTDLQGLHECVSDCLESVYSSDDKSIQEWSLPPPGKARGKECPFFAVVLWIVKACMHLICISKHFFWANMKFTHEPHYQRIATHAFWVSCIAPTINKIIQRFLSFIIKQTSPLTIVRLGMRELCSIRWSFWVSSNLRYSMILKFITLAQTSCWILSLLPTNTCSTPLWLSGTPSISFIV